MSWADEVRTLGIRNQRRNAGRCSPARKFGAEGIGLCRTEHMFFDGSRIVAMREMIWPTTRRAVAARSPRSSRCSDRTSSSCSRSWPACRSPSACSTRRCNEFLPKTQADMEVVAKDLGVDLKEIEARAHKRNEFQSHARPRGVRLGISYPEIYEMQARAIFEAVVEVQKKHGKTVIPEIMIPLVATKRELDLMKAVVDQVAAEVGQMSGEKLEYLVGTMTRLPRARCVPARSPSRRFLQLRPTNDLTQTTLGLEPRTVRVVPGEYQQRAFMEHDPFPRSTSRAWAS